MKLLYMFALLFLAMIIVIAGFQIFDYWWGLAYFPLVSTLFIGFIHLALMTALCWAFIKLFNYKVS